MTELVRIKMYLNRPIAECARMALEANGIEAIISADDAGGVRPELAMQKGVHILVKKEEADKEKTA